MPNLVVVLLVEDNSGDSTLLQQAFLEHFNIPHQFSVVNDGEAALAFLQQKATYANAPSPHLIILRYRSPEKNRLGSACRDESNARSGGDSRGGTDGYPDAS